MLWFLMMAIAGDWVYRMHSKWLPLERSTFNAIHYAGMAFYKTAVFIFNIVPLIALTIIDK